MTFDFFEGAAGTGKTHNLVGRAGEFVDDGILGEDSKVLALTFMNGARQRLEARLAQIPMFRRRFDCQTFDVFSRIVAGRRRSLVAGNAQLVEQAGRLDEFDGPCFLAGALLRDPTVSRWVASSYPLVIVDEAQDLDEHRISVLQGLAPACRIVAAADAFQCLTAELDTTLTMAWLEAAGTTERLTKVRRTDKPHLLAAALAVRQGRDITQGLIRSKGKGVGWYGQGFRLIESVASNSGIIAWAISNEIRQRTGPVVILTPDSRSPLVRGALEVVKARAWPRKDGQTFGPYPVIWEMQDNDTADALLADIQLSGRASLSDLRSTLEPLANHASVADALDMMNRQRRVGGKNEFTSAEVIEFVRRAVRNHSRFTGRGHRGNVAMTIQRAKNREFQNVIVLWPPSATGSPEHLRKLLYNGITRAITHCTVIVLGKGRLDQPPFIASSNDR